MGAMSALLWLGEAVIDLGNRGTYHSPREAGGSSLGMDLAVDLAVDLAEVVVPGVEEGLAVAVAVGLVRVVRGPGCPGPAGWPLYHQIDCLDHDLWQEERAVRPHHVAVNRPHPHVKLDLHGLQFHDATEQYPPRIWWISLAIAHKLA